MTDICKRESVSPEQVIFAFLCCYIYCYGLFKYNFFVYEGQLMKILGFIFSGDQEKSHVEFFDVGILRM